MGSFLLLLIAIGHADAQTPLSFQSAPSEYDRVLPSACGPISLYMALRLLGEPVQLTDLLDECLASKNPLNYEGSSLLDLQRVATRHGLVATLARLDLAALEDLQSPAILYVPNDPMRGGKPHFYLYAGWTSSGNCIVLDGNSASQVRQVWSRTQLQSMIKGPCLILSKSEVHLPSLGHSRDRLQATLWGATVLFALGLTCTLWSHIRQRVGGRSTFGGIGAASIAVSLAVCLCSCSRKPSEPLISVVENEYDFGRLPEGTEEVSHTFRVVNGGKEPLIIQDVQSSCGCTTVKAPKQPLLYRQTGEIGINVALKGGLGPQEFTVAVRSNDPHRPVVTLRIRGYVQGALVVAPSTIEFGEVAAGTSVESQLEVRLPCTDAPNPEHRIKLACESGAVHTEMKKKEIIRTHWGRMLLVHYRVSYTVSARPGTIEDAVVVTDTSLGKSARVELHGKIVGRVRVEPETVFLGLVREGQVKPTTVHVSARDGQPLAMREVSSSNEALQVATTETAAGYEISIVPDPAKIEDSAFSASVLIKTDDALQPVMTIPVIGFRAARP